MTDSEWAVLRKRMVGLATARFGPENAEDIVQDVFVRFVGNGHGPGIKNLEAYLKQAVMNKGKELWRRRKVREQHVTLVEDRVGEDWEYPEPDERLDSIKSALGEDGLEFLLRYYENGAVALSRKLNIGDVQLRVIICAVRAMLHGKDLDSCKRSAVRRFQRLAKAAA